MTKPMMICILLSLMFAAAAVAQDEIPRFRLTLRGWSADIDAETSLIEEVTGGTIDIDDELDLDKEMAPELRLRWQFRPRHAVELRALHLSYDADEYVIRPLLFDDDPGFLFNRLQGDISLTYARLGWRWAIVMPDTGRFRLETLLDIAGGEASADYKLYRPLWPFTSAEEDEVEARGALPTLGLAATLAPLRWFDFIGEVSGMTAGQYGYILDYELCARVKPWQWFAVEGGYRRLYIKGSDGDEDAEFEFDGPFAGASVSF